MKFKYVFFAISLLVILPGIFSLAKFGLKMSIDFSGGTLLEIQNSSLRQDSGRQAKLKTIYENQKIEFASAQQTSNSSVLIRSKSLDNSAKEKIVAEISKEFGETKVERFETVGPTIGAELTQKAMMAVGLASILIIIYIAYAFREIPPPYKSWRFGVCAVIALLHDVFVVIGTFSLLGHFFGAEIDSLFVTAILTIIGFSVHDTIVVFDRIRENLSKDASKLSFADVTNESILQTLVRSLNTSLTVVFTLLALILFGGESIRWFSVALLIGIVSGTYSSIFNAAPLLVLWEEKNGESGKISR